jgi:hypothetical protein
MSNIAIRHYEPADYEMLCAWWKAHHGMIRPEVMLPKCGVVCELDGKPVSALFLHMDNSCGMCMAEHAVSAPGLSLKKASLAFKHCVACLKKIAADLGYHTMCVFSYPSIARVLKSQGFSKTDGNLIQMMTSTKEVSNG